MDRSSKIHDRARDENTKQDVPTNKTRLWCYRLVNRKQFELVITICIVLNTVVMAMKYYTMTKKLEGILENCNYFFAAVFNVECVLKLIALGKTYFKDQWNAFDFIVVCGTNFGIISSLFSTVDMSSTASVIRGFRIMRIFRLIRSA